MASSEPSSFKSSVAYSVSVATSVSGLDGDQWRLQLELVRELNLHGLQLWLQPLPEQLCILWREQHAGGSVPTVPGTTCGRVKRAAAVVDQTGCQRWELGSRAKSKVAAARP